jgi:sugar/nucleoside kinase (ribokinase family)
MTKSVLVLGGVSWNTMLYVDTFPRPEPGTVFTRDYHETVGSTGSGKALNLSKLGFDVTLYGMIGEDHHGEWVKDYFAKEKVPFIYDLATLGTERHVNLMDEGGKRISIISRSGGSPERVDFRRIEPLIRQSDYVALNIVDYCRALIPLIKSHNKEIWCDIHDYDGLNPCHHDFIDGADFIFMGSDSMPDYRLFMEALIRRGKKLVVCTHGKEGSSAHTSQGEWIETPIISAYAKLDTNGAGDAFFSGFLYGYSQGYPLEMCLRIATVVAGLCVTSSELALPSLSSDLVDTEYARHYGVRL